MKFSFFQRLGGIFNRNKAFNGLNYDSSAIKSITFDPKNNEADIVYTGPNNKAYTFPMTRAEFNDFKDADSKGQWVAYQARRY